LDKQDGMAQLQLEAAISIALLLTLIASAIVVVNSLAITAKRNSSMLLAEATAQKCAVAANLLYSNGGGTLKARAQCRAPQEGGRAISSGAKTAFSIAEKTTTRQAGEKTLLEVTVNEHYR
jgi:hypothetical protein